MKNPLFLFLAAFRLALQAEMVLDVDFTKDLSPIDRSSAGSCRGVLPRGVGDNFTSWSEGSCDTTLVTEGNRTFLRFSSDAGRGVVQFAIPSRKLAPPCYFRITVEGRTRGNALAFGFRLNPSPYTAFSSHTFSAPAWKTESFLGHVHAKADASIGLYLYPGTGETDLARITVERVDRAVLARAIPRPPKSRTSFVDRRFPLGLPNGWNIDRDAETGTATAVSDSGSTIPVLRLASGPNEPFAVWGEPFQTSEPYTNHVVTFRCRGTGGWSAQVVTDTRACIKSAPVPVAATWQDVSFTFRPQDLARAFAVKFTGSGELFLDGLRVWYGEKTPPRPFPSAVALGPSGGEIAADTRIFFADENPALAWAAVDAPAGAVLALSLTDLYGRTRALPDVPLAGGAYAHGTLDLAPALAGLTGQFRVTGEVRGGGKAVSAPDEFVFTRIPRPLGWNRDMPDSPFGIHMEPRDATVRAMKAGGGWETCDVVDYHVYTPHPRARRTDANFTEKSFAPILAEHPALGGKPVYMSEGQGTSSGSQKATRHMSGLYARLVPWTPDTSEDMAANADATCRYTLSLLAEGNARVFLYTAHGYGGLVSPPNYITLVGADGFPYPSFAAYAVFTRALEGRRFASKADYGKNGCVFTFRAKDSGAAVRLYTDLDRDEAAALNARTPLADLYGNPFDAATWFPGTLLYAE